jgi:hypothetical protein
LEWNFLDKTRVHLFDPVIGRAAKPLFKVLRLHQNVFDASPVLKSIKQLYRGGVLDGHGSPLQQSGAV